VARTIDQFVRDFKRAYEKHYGDAEMKREMNAYAGVLKKERQKGIEAQRGPDGSSYAQLSPKTVERKRKKGSKAPDKALIDRGYLINPTITSTAKEGKVVRPKSRDDIITYHDQGSGSLPRRKNWGIYPDAEKEILKAWDLKLTRFAKEVARG
jgi:hypothetical protein